MREEEEQQRKEKVEKERKEKEEKERKEKEEKERVRQEKKFKRKENEIERKEIMLREVEIQHPTVSCIKKGVIQFLNSSSFVINSFVLVLPKIVFPPSPIIPYSSKDLQKLTFDLELPFKLQLSQSENHYFCEMGFIENVFKQKIPSSCIFTKYTLHGIQLASASPASDWHLH